MMKTSVAAAGLLGWKTRRDFVESTIPVASRKRVDNKQRRKTSACAKYCEVFERMSRSKKVGSESIVLRVGRKSLF
jgi:hypothetical protein